MPQTQLYNQFRTCRETTLPQKAVFVSVQADRNCLIPSRYENRSLTLFRLFSRLDLLYTGRLAGLVQRFSAFARTPSLLTGRFSAWQSDRYAVFANQWDANFLNVLRCLVSLDSVNIIRPMRLPISFDTAGKWIASAPLRREAINTPARMLLAAKFTSVVQQLQKISERFSENKNIAQRMLADILQNVELEKSGVLTNTEKHVKRPSRNTSTILKAICGRKIMIRDTLSKASIKSAGWCHFAIGDVSRT